MKKILGLALALLVTFTTHAAQTHVKAPDASEREVVRLLQKAATAQDAARVTATDATIAALASANISPDKKLSILWPLRHLASSDEQKIKLLEIAAGLKDPNVRMFIFENRKLGEVYAKAMRENTLLLNDGRPMPDRKKTPLAEFYGRNAFDARETYDSWDDVENIFGRYQTADKTVTVDVVAEPCKTYRARYTRQGAAPLDLLGFPASEVSVGSEGPTLGSQILRFIGPNLELKLKDGTLFYYDSGKKITLTRVAVGKTYFDKKPANATVLLDAATGLKNFTSGKKPPQWKLLPGGIVQSVPKTGSLHTAEKYSDSLIYIEFRTANNPEAMGQHRGNAGIFPQYAYEVQMLDSFGLDPKNNECGGIYTVSPASVNMAAPPLEWQSYLISYTAPRYNAAGEKTQNARLTVWHNGVKIQDNVEVPYNTSNNTKGTEPKEPGVISLQQHTSILQFRNMWIIPNPVETDIRAAADSLK